MLPPAGLPGYATAKNPFSQTSKLRSRFLPVILLVGAFDPLDEQEAQRVGADGVLKKPFVPPDPLISMVKSALMRAANAASATKAVAVTEKAPVPTLAVAGGPATAGGPNATVVSAPAVYVI